MTLWIVGARPGHIASRYPGGYGSLPCLSQAPTPHTDGVQMSLFELGKELFKQGSKGDMVEKLQGALKAAGVDPGKADGLFGAKTKDAVAAFQKKAGLSTDGVVGPMTAKALKQAAMDAATKAAKAKAAGGGGKDAKDAVGDESWTDAVARLSSDDTSFVVRAEGTFEQIGLFLVGGPERVSVRLLDGADWTEPVPVEITWREGALRVARLILPSGFDAVELVDGTAAELRKNRRAAIDQV